MRVRIAVEVHDIQHLLTPTKETQILHFSLPIIEQRKDHQGSKIRLEIILVEQGNLDRNAAIRDLLLIKSVEQYGIYGRAHNPITAVADWNQRFVARIDIQKHSLRLHRIKLPKI